MVVLAGCGTLAAAVPAATEPPPSATPSPPTPTPVPPTATPEPEPTEDVRVFENIAYNNVDDPRTRQRVSVYLPAEGSGPFPTIHFLGGTSVRTVQYRDLVDAWNARGYAVVVFEGHEGNPWISSQPYWCDHCEDLMCSWAWLQAHGTEYRLDPERVISFAHAYGLFAPLLAVADDALWTEMLATCPQPTPASKMVKGVAVYDGFYGLPDVDLILWRSNAASAYGVSYEAFGTVLDELTGVPPETWLDEGVLSPEARRIASFLPRAYLSDPRPDDVVPAFLIMTGDPAVDADAPVSEPMVAALTEAGLPVETWVLENGVYSSLIGAGTDAVADEVDAFAQRVFGDVQ